MTTTIQIESVLSQITEHVFTLKSLPEARQYTTDFLNGKDINEKDKKQMLRGVAEVTSLPKLQFYLANALLKYEGMSLSNLK